MMASAQMLLCCDNCGFGETMWLHLAVKDTWLSAHLDHKQDPHLVLTWWSKHLNFWSNVDE